MVAPIFRIIGGKLVQAIGRGTKGTPKGTPKVTAPTPTSTVVGGTSPSRLTVPPSIPLTVPKVVSTRPITRVDVDEIFKSRPISQRPSSYLDDVDDVALSRASQLADDAARAAAPVARVADDVVEDVVETAARRRFRPTPRGTLETVGSLAPVAVQSAESRGIDVPAPLEYGANVLGLLAGGSLLGRGLGKGGFRSAATRQAFGEKGIGGKIGDVLLKGALPAVGGITATTAIADTLRRMRSDATEAEATELEDFQALSPEDLLPDQFVTEDGSLSPEDEYLTEIQSAIDTLISNAESQASQELAAIDEQSKIEMDSIRRDYESRKEQVSNNYNAALDQISGYQDQADQLLTQAAAAAQAGYAQAAGGLENFQAPTGLTAEEAALSGISPTAVGGAAISGAALTRGLAGAEQAAAAAQRFRSGVDLGGELASTRSSQADTLAALDRNLLNAETVSRLSSSERKSEARRAKATSREAAINVQANAKLAVAEKVSNMTPAQLAAWRGSSASKKQFVAPSWFGKNVVGESTKAIPGVTLSTGVANIGALNDALSTVYAAMTDPGYTDPSTALANWNALFAELGPDVRKLLEYKKIPSNATAMYAELFKTAPGK